MGGVCERKAALGGVGFVVLGIFFVLFWVFFSLCCCFCFVRSFVVDCVVLEILQESAVLRFTYWMCM